MVFFAYWAVAALAAKKSVGTRAGRRGGALQLLAVVLIVLALRVPAVKDALHGARAYQAGLPLAIVGVSLCALGLGLAVWARIHLGRNWGMPMSRKNEPELVTTGPYTFVRHPIYGGIILAMLGSAISEGIVWLAAFVLLGAYCVYAARNEEKLMTEQFPDLYPEYKSRTKMLIPFVL